MNKITLSNKELNGDQTFNVISECGKVNFLCQIYKISNTSNLSLKGYVDFVLYESKPLEGSRDQIQINDCNYRVRRDGTPYIVYMNKILDGRIKATVDLDNNGNPVAAEVVIQFVAAKDIKVSMFNSL